MSGILVPRCTCGTEKRGNGYQEETKRMVKRQEQHYHNIRSLLEVLAYALPMPCPVPTFCMPCPRPMPCLVLTQRPSTDATDAATPVVW
eukprot:3046573-Rhodomonas_salina.3